MAWVLVADDPAATDVPNWESLALQSTIVSKINVLFSITVFTVLIVCRIEVLLYMLTSRFAQLPIVEVRRSPKGI